MNPYQLGVGNWSSTHFIHYRLILQRGGNIEIGWGNLGDINNNQNELRRENLLNAVAAREQQWKYKALLNLENLALEFPGRLRLKLLGTHEKFLVCDRSWAMIGSHNFLTSDDSKCERELGLKTNAPSIIADLHDRFDTAIDFGTETEASDKVWGKCDSL